MRSLLIHHYLSSPYIVNMVRDCSLEDNNTTHEKYSILRARKTLNKISYASCPELDTKSGSSLKRHRFRTNLRRLGLIVSHSEAITQALAQKKFVEFGAITLRVRCWDRSIYNSLKTSGGWLKVVAEMRLPGPLKASGFDLGAGILMAWHFKIWITKHFFKYMHHTRCYHFK